MSEEIIGAGTIFRFDGVAYARTQDVGDLDIERDDVQTTPLSIADKFHTYMPGMGDGGELEVMLYFQKDDCETLYGLMDDDASHTWAFELPDGSIWSGTGYIKNFGSEQEIDQAVMTPMTLKISGKPTFTAG